MIDDNGVLQVQYTTDLLLDIPTGIPIYDACLQIVENWVRRMSIAKFETCNSRLFPLFTPHLAFSEMNAISETIQHKSVYNSASLYDTQSCTSMLIGTIKMQHKKVLLCNISTPAWTRAIILPVQHGMMIWPT